MRIVQEQPPFFDELGKTFRLTENTVFTFGDILYNPSNSPISRPVYAHEETHSKQQGDNPKQWWERYIAEPDFCLSQEIEAYQRQYQEAKKMIKDRNHLFRYALALARDLSSPLYGSIISTQEALTLIKNNTR